MMRFRIQIDPALLEMTPEEFQLELLARGACEKGRAAFQGLTPMEAWARCPNGYYMFWALVILARVSWSEILALQNATLPNQSIKRTWKERCKRADSLRAMVDFYL